MIGYAIVGCGHIANKHVTALDAVSGAKLVAVCDTDPTRLAPFVSDDVKGYTSLDEMLTDPRVEVVSICTPTGLHPALTIQAAEAGKHVLVEKPMALTLADADKMIEVCEKNRVKLAVVHPNRFRPAIEKMKRRLQEGAFGKLSHANATVRWNRNQAYYDQAPWRGTKAMDGGVLMNQAIHNMDLLLWMMGEAEEVSSYAATRLRDIETEDVSVSVIRFKNGALGVLEAAVTLYPRNLEESLSLFGEKGTAVIGGSTANWIKEWKFADLTEEEAEASRQEIEADPFGISGHQCMIEDLTEAILEHRAPLVSGREGREVLKLVLACQQSANSGLPVNLDTLEKNLVG